MTVLRLKMTLEKLLDNSSLIVKVEADGGVVGPRGIVSLCIDSIAWFVSTRDKIRLNSCRSRHKSSLAV